MHVCFFFTIIIVLICYNENVCNTLILEKNNLQWIIISTGAPEPPSNPPEIMEVTKTTVALSWARPRDDGGSRITGYFVERREVSTEKWVRHNKTHITTTMYNVAGLIPDAEYMFRVVAQNDIGKSEPGPASEPVICKDPFGK